MPLYIEEKRTYNKAAWLTHKKLVSSLVMYQRYVRGGHPEYNKDIAEIKRKIAINKINS